MRKLPPPRHRFRIFVAPRTSPQYFEVLLHSSRRKMLAWRKTNSKCEAFMRPDDEAWTINFENGKETRFGNARLGAIHFHPGSLTMGIIAHELYHAVSCYARIVGCVTDVHTDWNSEELCAEAIGSMTAQFYCELVKLRKYDKHFHVSREREYFE